MARKARFATPATAEAWAVQKGAPVRGSGVPITSATRGLVRFWLTASGIPSERAVMFSVGQMSAAWHDMTGETLARLRDETPATPATPATPEPAPWRIETPEPKNEEDTKAMQEQMPFNRPAPAAMPQDDHAAALAALQRILAPKAPALDESAVLDIVHRHMGATISAATTSATEQARTELADIVEEARAIVNGAPRTLRIEMAGRIRNLPASPRHPMFDALLTFVVAGREPGGLPVMIVGPAGSGKTTACQHVAEALALPFYTNGALTGAHELTGYKDAAGQYHGTPFRQAFEHGGVYLMDELDRSDPAAVLALNSALANGFMAFPDKAEPVKAHPDFIAIVAANTYGRGADRLYVGANQLDAATLDRFATLSWDYDEALERALAGDDAWTAYVQAARAAAAKHKIRHVISPRASMGGATVRRTGAAFDMVADAFIWKGLDAEQRARITAEIPDNIARRAQAPRVMIAAE
jgi:cobaltochelatase CobS